MSWLRRVKNLAALVMPGSRTFPDVPDQPFPLRWVIPLVVHASILTALIATHSEITLPGIGSRKVWVFAALGFAILWLVAGLRTLLAPSPDMVVPEADQAWKRELAAVEARLAREGKKLTDLPLFLVLGRSGDALGTMVQSAGPAEDQKFGARPGGMSNLPVQVSPVKILIEPRCLLVCGSGSSRLGPNDWPGPKDDFRQSFQGYTSTLEAPPAEAPPDLGPLVTPLRRVCQLIRRERKELPPLNGLLLWVPFSALRNEETALEFGRRCQADLAAVREELQVHCPLYAVLEGLEELPGYSTFLDLLPRLTAGGEPATFPPYLKSDAIVMVPALVSKEGVWTCRDTFRAWLYESLHKLALIHLASAVEPDRRLIELFRVLPRMREHESQLAHVLSCAIGGAYGLDLYRNDIRDTLSSGVILDESRPMLFGGCYPARLSPSQTGLVNVLDLLLYSRRQLCWTPETIQEDRDYQRWAWWGWFVIGAVCATLLAWGLYLLWQFWPAG